MAGFTLYETLRILVPGTIAVVIVDLVLRIGLEADPNVGAGATQTVSSLESTAIFAAAALIVGLLLYLLDLPMRTRLSREGDPTRGWRLPSAVLREKLEGDEELEPKSFSMYFLLSDQYLPDEFHRRVYLFGSLYRVFVDLRFLLGFAATIGPAAALLVASHETGFDGLPSLSTEAAVTILGMIVAIAAIGATGVRSHSLARRRKRSESTLQNDLKTIRWVAGAIFGLGALSAALLASGFTFAQLIGVPLLAAALFLWSSVEMGPPKAQPDGSDWRSPIMIWLRAQHDGPQYSALQRAVCDLAVFAPWIVVAWIVTAAQHQPATAAAAWAIFIVPSVAIATVRKHELRLLGSYEDQSNWLDLHEHQIAKIKTDHGLLDRWE